MKTRAGGFCDSGGNDCRRHLYDVRGAGPHFQHCDSGTADPAFVKAGDTLRKNIALRQDEAVSYFRAPRFKAV